MGLEDWRNLFGEYDDDTVSMWKCVSRSDYIGIREGENGKYTVLMVNLNRAIAMHLAKGVETLREAQIEATKYMMDYEVGFWEA